MAVFRDVREGITRDRVLAIAAGVTFYSLLAIFPAIAALVALYGLFADPAAINQHLDALSGLLPGGALDVMRDQIARIAAQGGGTLGLTFVIGLLLSVWSADGGIKALFDALNVVYRVPEKRGVIRLGAISLAFVVGGTAFLLLAIAAVVSFPAVSNLTSIMKEARWLVAAAEWPVMLVVVALALGLLYRYGPSRPPPKWRWVTWGSAFGSVGWVLASVLFSWYAANFGSFNKTYGSLGAVIGFMTWIWISTIVVLVGAGINAAVERLDGSTRDELSALKHEHGQHGGGHNRGCNPT